ncbi:Brp/Blh family beta-carotene 15,15'-dioxygenase [Sphingomonas arantia]|uniref:Probable beta-carotene 15,15'-dioxygenase n=1 Tax=Sphingomonas arantia TaxID=1460676 RepID=A0ABW4TZS7_9SPHN
MTAAVAGHHDRRVHTGRGEVVRPAFWIAALFVGMALALGLPLDGPTATLIATGVFVVGGMPHGAYDIALLSRATRLGRRGLGLALGGYIAIAAAIAALWVVAPLLALVLFLIVASVHFGEDWTMIEEPLFRVAAGTAILAAPAISHFDDVARLFIAMSGTPYGATVARALIAVAPVALLVTIVGIATAWRDGARAWAAATTVAIVGLIVAPPVAGFALFFVFLHSPRHFAEAGTVLHGRSRGWWMATGALMSAAAILGWVLFATLLRDRLTPDDTAQAFQLLATVAVPHLVFSRWIERRLARDVT